MPDRGRRDHHRSGHRLRSIRQGVRTVAAPPQVVQIASPQLKLAAQVQPTVTATNLQGLLIEWLQRQEGRRGQTAEATSGASASAATNDDTGAKRGKKEATGKKE
jgi:hypothetical protein